MECFDFITGPQYQLAGDEKHVLSDQDWPLVRSKLVPDRTNDLLTDKNYLQVCHESKKNPVNPDSSVTQATKTEILNNSNS